jgi:hypothetical protein
MPPAIIDEESALHHVDPASMTAAVAAANAQHHNNNNSHLYLGSSPTTPTPLAAITPGIATIPSMDEGLRKSHIRASITSSSNNNKKVANQKPPPRLLHPYVYIAVGKEDPVCFQVFLVVGSYFELG